MIWKFSFFELDNRIIDYIVLFFKFKANKTARMSDERTWKKKLAFFRKNSQILLIVLTPVLTMIIPLAIQTKAANCAFVVICMVVFWLTEAIPIGVTSLLPVVLFPMLGIMPSEKVTIGYFKV